MAKPEKIKTKKKIILSHLLPLNEWVLSIEEELKRKNKTNKLPLLKAPPKPERAQIHPAVI